jgi:hypothetical protein
MENAHRNYRGLAIVLLTVGVIMAACLLPPLAQDPAYHGFADKRAILSIPNGLNVLSNLAFFLVGVVGVWRLFHDSSVVIQRFHAPSEVWAYASFFISIALIAPGSAYYHLAPDNGRLVWDRLPMSVSFAALVAVMIGERISPKLGVWSLLSLIAIAVASVLYWRFSANWGQENLWPYVAVQFYGLTLIFLLGCFFAPRYSHGPYFMFAIVWYVLAKLAEHFDTAILSVSGFLSGHSVKHLLAAVSVYCVLRMLELRRPLTDEALAPNSPSS